MGGIDPKNLVNSAQVAERLGLKQRESVFKLRDRYAGFPDPVYARGRVMLWDWLEVEAWAARPRARRRPDDLD